MPRQTEEVALSSPGHPHLPGLASWREEASAATALKDVLTNQLRVLGPDHPDTLTTRSWLTYWHGQANSHTE
jgi:hypothetical protein